MVLWRERALIFRHIRAAVCTVRDGNYSSAAALGGQPEPRRRSTLRRDLYL